MQNKSVPQSLLVLLIAAIFFNSKANAQLTSLSENFDVVAPDGWSLVNHSTGNGLPWYQGDVRKFSAHSGDNTSYAAASYLSVGRPAIGTISNWMISPELNIANGGSFSFYTRTTDGSAFADRLEVRLSVSGSSINTGSNPDDTGDFSTVLLTINPTLEVGGYPDTGWTKYTIPIAGVPGVSAGRIAFRYYVTNGGSRGTNSNFIGVDDVSYEGVLPVRIFNFTGAVINKQAVLSWSTAEEINNKGFDVEASRDNRTFSSIGFVSAMQNKSGVNNYRFTDEKLASGTTYYRLKQIDKDGGFLYSAVVKLDFKNFAWDLIGNSPGYHPYLQLQTLETSDVTVQVIAANGKPVQTINKNNLATGIYNIPLDINNTAHGIYIIKLIVNKDAYSKKLIK